MTPNCSQVVCIVALILLFTQKCLRKTDDEREKAFEQLQKVKPKTNNVEKKRPIGTKDIFLYLNSHKPTANIRNVSY